MIGPWTSREIASTASKSPGEAIGKPASMTSTFSRASWWAISSFSAVLSEMPGDCSPSRRVVSKIRTWFGSGCVLLMTCGAPLLKARGVLLLSRFAAVRPPRR